MSRRLSFNIPTFLASFVVITISISSAYVVPNRPMAFVGLAGIQNSVQHHHHHHSLTLSAATGATADDNNNSNNSSTSGTGGIPQLATFREAEVLGLRYMQEGNYEQALKVFQQGMKLPGSDRDVLRTKSLSGPSPVGGSMGGFESQNTFPLDEFELQAAHYNIACAQAQLGNLDESIANLQKSFENGFNNFATVRGDPDLDPVKNEADFKKLMDSYDGKGFNPFGFLGKQ